MSSHRRKKPRPSEPQCPNCRDCAIDGHITCGRLDCDEAGMREKKLQLARHFTTRARVVYSERGIKKTGALAPKPVTLPKFVFRGEDGA